MGFHFLRYVNSAGTVEYLPSMHGSGDNEVILYPNLMVSIVMAKASVEVLGPAEKTRSDDGPVTIRASSGWRRFEARRPTRSSRDWAIGRC